MVDAQSVVNHAGFPRAPDGASATAREKVEAAGGTLTLLKEPKVRKPKNMKRRPEGRQGATAPEAPEATEQTEGEE